MKEKIKGNQMNMNYFSTEKNISAVGVYTAWSGNSADAIGIRVVTNSTSFPLSVI